MQRLIKFCPDTTAHDWAVVCRMHTNQIYKCKMYRITSWKNILLKNRAVIITLNSQWKAIDGNFDWLWGIQDKF